MASEVMLAQPAIAVTRAALASTVRASTGLTKLRRTTAPGDFMGTRNP